MKKFNISKLLIFSILILTWVSLSAEEQVIQPVYKRKNHDEENYISKAPLHLPIEIILESSTGALTVTAEEISGKIILFRPTGKFVAYSSNLNTSFQLKSNGYYIITLQGDDWSGEAKFNYVDR